ncbi:hypothetical protein GCM10028791_28070 [Echinicola sediminis]
MGFYLLNISVDTADPDPQHLPEDLSINDQESIVELVVEKFLGFENAFKEYDDPDTEKHDKKKNVKIDLLVHFSLKSAIIRPHLIIEKQAFPDHKSDLPEGFDPIDSPPPKI